MAENGFLQTLWDECFAEAVDSEVASSGISETKWRAGGRASKEYPNKEDATWWNRNGYTMLQQFVDWWNANNDWYVWETPSGQLGVELALFSDFNGIPVRAFADLVCYDNNGELAVVDFKTGSGMPVTGMQLGLYATLVEILFGVRPTAGYFYDARKGVMCKVDDVHRWTKPVFDHLFGKFAIAIEHEIFLPNVGMMCSSCGVRNYCYAVSGNIGADPLGDLRN